MGIVIVGTHHVSSHTQKKKKRKKKRNKKEEKKKRKKKKEKKKHPYSRSMHFLFRAAVGCSKEVLQIGFWVPNKKNDLLVWF
jgi:hypothetical protein